MDKSKPSVLELISRRHAAKHLKHDYKDDYKLCLAVEGGAMRGIVSAGMMLALRDLNMLGLFDMFVGSSGGSFNMAYILSGKGDSGLSIYYDHMINRDIINAYNALPGGGNVVNMENLETVISKIVRMDNSKLLNEYGDRVYIAATNVDKLKGETFKLNDIKDNLIDFLLAGATIPVVGGDSRHIGHTDYCDASLYYIDPVQAAAELDCTHIMVLNTSTAKKTNAADADKGNFYLKVFDRLEPGLGRLYMDRIAHYRRTFDGFVDGGYIFDGRPAYSLAVQPKGHQVRRLTTDQWKLVSGARAGYKAVTDLFAKDATVSIVPKLVL